MSNPRSRYVFLLCGRDALLSNSARALDPSAILMERWILHKLHRTKQFHRQIKAYENMRFLESKDARALRILAEYLEPLSRFKRYGVRDTIVFMGSARLMSRETAERALAEAKAAGIGLEASSTSLELSTYY